MADPTGLHPGVVEALGAVERVVRQVVERVQKEQPGDRPREPEEDEDVGEVADYPGHDGRRKERRVEDRLGRAGFAEALALEKRAERWNPVASYVLGVFAARDRAGRRGPPSPRRDAT